MHTPYRLSLPILAAVGLLACSDSEDKRGSRSGPYGADVQEADVADDDELSNVSGDEARDLCKEAVSYFSFEIDPSDALRSNCSLLGLGVVAANPEASCAEARDECIRRIESLSRDAGAQVTERDAGAQGDGEGSADADAAAQASSLCTRPFSSCDGVVVKAYRSCVSAVAENVYKYATQITCDVTLEQVGSWAAEQIPDACSELYAVSADCGQTVPRVEPQEDLK